MPTFVTCGVVCVVYASTHCIQGLSTHMGWFPSDPGMPGKQVQPLFPARKTIGASPSFAGQSRTVDFADTTAGAAVIALAIFCSFVIIVLLPIGIARGGIECVACPPAISATDSPPVAAKPASPISVLRTIGVVLRVPICVLLSRRLLRSTRHGGYDLAKSCFLMRRCNQLPAPSVVPSATGSAR